MTSSIFKIYMVPSDKRDAIFHAQKLKPYAVGTLAAPSLKDAGLRAVQIVTNKPHPAYGWTNLNIDGNTVPSMRLCVPYGWIVVHQADGAKVTAKTHLVR